MAGEGGVLAAGGQVPDPQGAVAAAADRPGAVRGDGHRPHWAGVAGQDGPLASGGQVPDPNGPVTPAADRQGAVRAERH